MIQFDLHVHTIFSHCGIHTVLELLARAKELGMKGFAVTDHGLGLKLGGRLTDGVKMSGRLNNPFFERFRSPDPAVKILKGVECNVLDAAGKIDAPREFMKHIDVILLGLHPNLPANKDKTANTDLLITAMRKNPCVDIITHPNDNAYPVDYKRLAREAALLGVALELNNSKVMYARTGVETVVELVETCRDEGCCMALNSDTHAIHELGVDDNVRPILAAARFPEELIVNRTEESTMEFINSRRKNKIIVESV